MLVEGLGTGRGGGEGKGCEIGASDGRVVVFNEDFPELLEGVRLII